MNIRADSLALTSVAASLIGGLALIATPAQAQTRPSIAALQSQITAQQTQITALQANNVPGLATYLAVDTSTPARPVARFHGVNVQIVDDLGAGVDEVNGLGNLIVGYNEVRISGAPVCSWGGHTSESTCVAAGGTWSISHKSGSHNVVIGAEHNYSRGGSLVAGYRNTITGDFASVTGGTGNTASGGEASVSGGDDNTASGDHASVSGGSGNTASAFAASVSGGNRNMASGESASVSGGTTNTASGFLANVSGGFVNMASGLHASVSGGVGDVASGDESSVSGGVNSTASGYGSSVSGGESNQANGPSSSVSGGLNRSVLAADQDGWRAGSLHEDF